MAPSPRTILYTGKGGVGKTSVAAATARRLAAAGRRTIVLSTDPAHSLADVLEATIGPEPTDLGGGLWAQQVQAQVELERNWASVQGWLGALLVERGVDRIAAEELSVPPGGDELFSLLQLKRHVDAGEWDAIVVDCAPTGETLRLLSFPDVARWWLNKVMGRETALLSAARPLARAFLDVSLPDERVFADVQSLIGNLVAMNEILRGERASLRLVCTPDRMVVKETMRTFTYLNLFGFVTDAVVVNRVFPEAVEGTYFSAWRALQREQLELVEQGFAPVPVLRAPFFDREVMGAQQLDALGDAVFADADPEAVLHASVSQVLTHEGDVVRLRLELPFATKGEVSLKQVGLELVVRVGPVKRTIALPAAMGAMRPSAAAFADGALVVTFEPDAGTAPAAAAAADGDDPAAADDPPTAPPAGRGARRAR